MKIESNIRSLLNAKGKVSVANLGTFTTAQASAEVTESGGVIAPPQAKVLFSEDEHAEFDAPSLLDYLVSSGQMSESDAELELETFSKGIKNTIITSGKAGMGSLGYFQRGMSGLEFMPNDSSSMGGDSFGLPKVTARPLVPVPITDDVPMTGNGDKLLLKAILIPLIILSVVLVYFLIDKDAYNNLSSYFGSTTIDKVDPPKKDNTNLTDNTKKDSLKTDGTGNKTDNDNPKTDNTSNKTDETNKVDNSKTDSTKKDDGKSNVITTSTSRFYIIIGSFTNDKAAQKAVAKCKRVGYPNAKVLKMNNKIRVSVEDHTKRSEAMTKATKIGKDFPGAWVLAN